MLSAFHLYTQYVRGVPIAVKLVIGDTMISHSYRTGKNKILTFQTWDTDADGVRTGVFVPVAA